MHLYILFWICIIGLCLGSFYNVVILRSLSEESIVFPPSKCPKCGNKLLWWHNIPILSYILLRGKCYFCKEKISIQYPIIEFTTMLVFALVFIKFDISLKTLFLMFWSSCFIIMTVTDLKEKLVDCNIAIAVGISGILYGYLSGGLYGILWSVLGILAGILILEAVARVGYIIAGTRAMGEADTYVAAAIGAMFGIQNLIPILLYGLIASMIFIAPIFLYNRFKANDKRTCIFSILFLISIVVYKSAIQNYYSLIGLVITGILLAFSILKGMKQVQNRNYLPYVPALCAGVIYYTATSF